MLIEWYSITVESVNHPEPRPTLRQERAAVTRRRILEAARVLFFRDGYAATTLKAVAAEAGVAVQTIYAVFGSKLSILAELRALVVSLPEADDAMREAMREPTLEGRLAGFAHSIRRRWELAGDIVKVNEDAARADPEIRAGVELARGRRQEGIRAFVHGLEEDVEAELDSYRGVAILDALTMYDLYAQLVGVHGWSPHDYEIWLRSQLMSALAAADG
jgi:TetR/AcrR family transcriptional regulator, regulator of autoinduction and epiphytic fitness